MTLDRRARDLTSDDLDDDPADVELDGVRAGDGRELALADPPNWHEDERIRLSAQFVRTLRVSD